MRAQNAPAAAPAAPAQAQPAQPHRPKKYDGIDGPLYESNYAGHYGACQKIALANEAPDPNVFTGPWQNVSQGLTGQARDILNVYWQNQVTKLEGEEHDFKMHQLPLARIKKVMKADPEVKMISAEAPILFAKGCDIFIVELTMRAWIHAEENKRRTLQRSDIASALQKSDMFDFLIDIVPREEMQGGKKHHPNAAQHQQAGGLGPHGAMQGMPGPHMAGAPEYAMDPHMGQPGMYAAPPVQGVQQGDGGAGQYQQHGGQMDSQFMYNAYAMPQQP